MRRSQTAIARQATTDDEQSDEPVRVGALRVLDEADEHEREEAAEPAGGADDARRGARVVRELLRHDLEDGAAARAEECAEREAGDRHRHDARRSGAAVASTAASIAIPAKPSTSTGNAPTRSANQPPTGRASVAAMTKPAARALASPFE